MVRLLLLLLLVTVQAEERSSSHPNIVTWSSAATTDHAPFSESAEPPGSPTRTPPPHAAGEGWGGEAALFPGEAQDNGPDTSAAAPRTHSPGTRDDTNTRPREASSSAGLYTANHTQGYEESKSSPTSGEETLDSESTVFRRNPHVTVENTRLHLKEKVQSVSATRSSHFEHLHSTSSSMEKHLTVGSTESPHITTKSQFQDITLSTTNISQTELGQNTTFDLLKSTEENAENTHSAQKSSGGTSSSSLVQSSDTTQTSSASTLSSTSEFDAETTESNDLLTGNSYFGGHTTSTEVVSTLSPGTLANTTLSDGSSSATHSTIPVQQSNSAVANDGTFRRSESPGYTTSRTDTASAKVQDPQQFSKSSGKYGIPPSSTTASQTVETTEASTRGSARLPSWPPEPDSVTFTRTYPSSAPVASATVQPQFYIVPDEPVTVRVESVELLLQILLEDSTLTAGVEEDAALWLEPYLQRAPGFREVLGVWSSGAAVQCRLEFSTRAALQWLPHTGASSLLDRTGLKQAVHEGRSFRAARIINITLEGLPEACDWLLLCPPGFTCAFDSHTSNFSCASVCHTHYCQHHGLCTHHPAQPPLCRCVAGRDFWFMGARCEVQMTRARLALLCLGVLLLLLGLVAGTAGMLVRRYRALLIQAKVEQSRSRFNHFDELSGRFWPRSGAGSADSLDNPAFTRSTEILHLRALERPCCYHDDSLSLPSTCPSPGTHIRSIHPHSSQYTRRGSNLSLVDGVLDSGKASDLSVCSWPLEPIQWSPFPLLQQLSRQQAPVVRMLRPRSYCDGMELVEVNKSWTA